MVLDYMEIGRNIRKYRIALRLKEALIKAGKRQANR